MSNPNSSGQEVGDQLSRRTKSAFVQIVLIEAVIIVALWILGRIFS